MPSTSPPLPHHYSPTTSSHFAATAAHSWQRFGFHQHQPGTMYDTSSDLYSHQDYTSTDQIHRPPSLAFSSPAQQAVPPATRYSSPMSRHPAWTFSGYTQSHTTHFPVDTRGSSFEPSIAHKVWLLGCKHCLTFLTNRGMKAVLLLRPHVALYSTDALPVNCSAYSARPPSIETQPNEHQPRTCECLTQTLCCHGCGTSVGYTIVVPCARCTSSGAGASANRVTNGHRFVFHSSELIASERHYTPGEPGILPAYTKRPSSVLSPNPVWSPRSFFPSTPDTAEMRPSDNTMQPLAFESPCPGSSPVFADPLKPSPQPLRVGDTLYWHHLKQGGEIPGATNDPRARGFHPIVFDR